MQSLCFSSADALPPGIEVFRLDLDLAREAEASDAWHVLIPDEHTRAARFVRNADRVRFAATRATLRQLLAQRMGCAPMDLVLGAGPHGKPFVQHAADPRLAPLFNVAHSGAHALIALADPAQVSDIGVDIERVDAGIELQAMAGMVFTPRERDAIDAAADPVAAFFLRWSGKEAVLKALGLGITEHLQSIGLQPDGAHGLAIETAMAEWASLQAGTLAAPQGYAAALAWRVVAR